jgi:5-methylthioadenosine/S-adenosylhomocysteine deaminase
MVWLSKEDIRAIADSGTHVVHCPSSNMKLASGACPVSDLLNAGINVALGTDGAASNNGLNLLAEVRLAALLAKLTTSDPASLRAEQALYMATLGGAKALGLDHETGSLEPGKWADLIAINFDDAAMQPLHNPISQVVYAGHGAHVQHSWVAGRQLLNDGKLQTLDEAKIIRRAQTWREKIASTAESTTSAKELS